MLDNRLSADVPRVRRRRKAGTHPAAAAVPQPQARILWLSDSSSSPPETISDERFLLHDLSLDTAGLREPELRFATLAHAARGIADAPPSCVLAGPELAWLDAGPVHDAWPEAVAGLMPSAYCRSTFSAPQSAGPHWTAAPPLSGDEHPLLLRDRRDGKAVLCATPPERLLGFLDDSPIAAIPVGPIAQDARICRLFIVLDIRNGRVRVLPSVDVRKIDPDAAPDIGIALARIARDAAAPGARAFDALEDLAPGLPGLAQEISEQIGGRLLTRPDVIGMPMSARCLPIVAIDILPIAHPDWRALVLGCAWSAFDRKHVSGRRNLTAWAAIAEPHLRRPKRRPLLILPQDRIDPVAKSGRIHPLEPLFPVLCGERGHVMTRAVPGTQIVELSPLLKRTSAMGGQDASGEMVRHLARATVFGGDITGCEPRLVEPGVGRSYLVDGLRVEGRPELVDFAVTGAGLTPYSIAGYMNAATHITGRAALMRLQHRRRCGDTLEQEGGRVTPVLAIFQFPGETAPLPDGGETEAGVAVRGFRSVLRVRQLDPAAVYYQSIQHAPLLGEAIVQRARLAGLDCGEDEGALLRSLDSLAGGFDDVRRFVWPSAVLSRSAGVAGALRRWLVANYAPAVLTVICDRLGRELGATPSTAEYVRWFADTMGRQLMLWRQHRFLHDYHKPGIERYSGLMTLVESNVTLLVEFPDLDTAIFVDDDYYATSLQLTARDMDILRTYYNEFHAREVEAGRAVVKSLACMALPADENASDWAVAVLDLAYSGEGTGR